MTPSSSSGSSRWSFRNIRLSQAALTEVANTGESVHKWKATVHVQNAGTGKMPIEIAALSGEHSRKMERKRPNTVNARQHIVLGAGKRLMW